MKEGPALWIRSIISLQLKANLSVIPSCTFEAAARPSEDIGGIWPLDPALGFTRYCETFISGFKERAQTLPRRFAKVASDEDERKAIVDGRVAAEDLRNYKDNLETARAWVHIGVPSLLVWSCFACAQYIADYNGFGLTALETRMHLRKLIENATTKCKHLKTFTTTNENWMTVLDPTLISGLGTFWEQLQIYCSERQQLQRGFLFVG